MLGTLGYINKLKVMCLTFTHTVTDVSNCLDVLKSYIDSVFMVGHITVETVKVYASTEFYALLMASL